MKTPGIALVMAGAAWTAVLGGLIASLPAGAQQDRITVPAQQIRPELLRPRNQVDPAALRDSLRRLEGITRLRLAPTYLTREQRAPAPIRVEIQRLRTQLIEGRLPLIGQRPTFLVTYTEAMDRSLSVLAGTRPPRQNPAARQRHNRTAARALAIDERVIQNYARRQGQVLRETRLLRLCSTRARSFDWRDHGVVTPVRDQDGCGSCWAFSAQGAYEASYAIRNNRLLDTSEQQVLNCSGAGTCRGGWPHEVFEKLLIPTGTTDEANLPYRARDAACPALRTPYHAVAWGWVADRNRVPPSATLKQALCRYGPLSVTVRVTPAFQAYGGGVFNENARGAINHAVTLVGWNDDDQAWIIKNSWGAWWGESGYMRIRYGSNSIGKHATWVRARNETVLRTDCVDANHRRAQVRKVNGRWKIVVGRHWLLDFGNKRREAERALAIMRHYHVDQQCFVGRPKPGLSYFLTAGRAPAGRIRGEDCIGFNPDNLDVNKKRGKWVVMDGDRWLFSFGNVDDAWLAAGLVTLYRFQRTCYVGRPQASLVYLRR